MRENSSSPDLPAFCRTAFWVAAARDIESRRPDALFRDPFIGPLAGELGREFRSARRGFGSGRGLVIRTVVIDQLITRAFRCALPADLRWFDVDLPDLVAYRRERLATAPPRCRYEMLAADLLDGAARREVLARATAGASVVLVLTEGFLLYLTEEQAGGIAADLARRAAVRYWMISVSRPRAPAARRDRAAAGPDAIRGRFHPESGLRFFEKFGFRERDFRSTLEEGIRLGRPLPFARLSLFARRFQTPARREEIRRAQGVALLEADRRP
jgi:O-methyltransferase involved in polyketide biosynthesis